MKNPPDGKTWSGVETDKKTNDIQARHFVARDVERYVGCIETQREAKVGYRRNQKLDNAGKLCSIYFIDPADELFKEILKNARRKLEIPMPAAMLCNFNVTSTG